MQLNSSMTVTLLSLHKHYNPTKKQEFEEAITTCKKVSKLIKDPNTSFEEINNQHKSCEDAFRLLQRFMIPSRRKPTI